MNDDITTNENVSSGWNTIAENGNSRLDRLLREERERIIEHRVRGRGFVGFEPEITINKKDNMSNEEQKLLEEITGFKFGDYVVCVENDDFDISYRYYDWKKGKVFQINSMQKNIYKGNGDDIEFVACLGSGGHVPHSFLKIATDDDKKNYEKMKMLRKSVDKTERMINVKRDYASQGKDISEYNKLKLNHPDETERRRKHNPPTDEKGFSEEDLEM